MTTIVRLLMFIQQFPYKYVYSLTYSTHLIHMLWTHKGSVNYPLETLFWTLVPAKSGFKVIIDSKVLNNTCSWHFWFWFYSLPNIRSQPNTHIFYCSKERWRFMAISVPTWATVIWPLHVTGKWSLDRPTWWTDDLKKIAGSCWMQVA